MTSNEQAPQQIREYKDFTAVTSIRKVVQQSIAPTIKTLQLQLSGILEQHQDINRKLMKMDDVFKNQVTLDKKIEETNKIISDHKQQLMQKRKDDERKSSRLDTANEKLFIELHALKTKTENQDETIQQITIKNNRTNQMYSALSATNEKTLKQVQQKFSDFTKQLLLMSKDIKTEHNQIQSEIDTVRQTFKSQRQALQQKAKPLELYLSERQSMNDKFHDIFGKIMQTVTKDDLEGYRKSQLILFKDKTAQIQNKIEKILPQPLRKILPTIQKKLSQVDKIKSIQKYCTELQNSIKEAEIRSKQVQNAFNLKMQAYEENIKQQNNRMERQLSNKLLELEKMQHKTIEQFEQKINQMKVELQQQVSMMIERQTSQIHKTIEAEVASNSHHRKSISDRSKCEQPQLITQARADEILAQLEKVQDIKEKVFGRYNRIQQLGRSIQGRIQGYSSKITKIKSDYELFSENMRRQMSGVIKFRDTFLERLMEVGGLLSTFAEALLINTSILIQNEQRQQHNQQRPPHSQSKEQITFVTENDGIIYEWKPENSSGIIQYRKQKLQSRQFLYSFMYSLTTFIDDQFTVLNFLNWNQQKPSEFFHQRLLSNYYICIKRSTENRGLQKQTPSHKNRRHSFNSSNPISQNQNSWIAPDTDQQNTAIDPSGSTKQFSRTIDSKLRFEKTLQQGNYANTNIQSNKNYSIKRQKPLSGKSKSKPKADNGLTRYDQVFLTSRSACRSRLSQML